MTPKSRNVKHEGCSKGVSVGFRGARRPGLDGQRVAQNLVFPKGKRRFLKTIRK